MQPVTIATHPGSDPGRLSPPKGPVCGVRCSKVLGWSVPRTVVGPPRDARHKLVVLLPAHCRPVLLLPPELPSACHGRAKAKECSCILEVSLVSWWTVPAVEKPV